MTQRPHFSPDRPEFKKGQAHKNPYTDQLKIPLHQPDTRIKMVKPESVAEVPIYNEIYDSVRSRGAWRHCADNFASGSLLTVASSTVTAPVTLKQSPEMRLARWPGAVQLYLVINQFSIAPQVVPATAAALDAVYQDGIGGYQVPLGEFMNTTGGNTFPGILIPVAVTDPGITNVGTLLLTDPVGGTTVATYDWQITFGYAYLLAAILGNELKAIQGSKYSQEDADL